jgi:hypothetical protein
MEQKIRNILTHPAAPMWCLLGMAIAAGIMLGASL